MSTEFNATAARQVVDSDAPSLIVSDPQSEERDGLQLIEQLRGNSPTCR